MRSAVIGGVTCSLFMLFPAIVCVRHGQWLGASGWVCAAVCMAAGHVLLHANRAESELARQVTEGLEELRRLDAEITVLISQQRADKEARQGYRS